MASVAKLQIIDLPEFLTIDTCVIDAKFIEKHSTGQYKGFPFMHDILGSSTERLATFVTDTRIKKSSVLARSNNVPSSEATTTAFNDLSTTKDQTKHLMTNSSINTICGNHFINSMKSNANIPVNGLAHPEETETPPSILLEPIDNIPTPMVMPSAPTSCAMILSSVNGEKPILSIAVASSSINLNTAHAAPAAPLTTNGIYKSSNNNCTDKLISCGTMTDDVRHPRRERDTQTLNTGTVDAAIQCNDHDFDEWGAGEPAINEEKRREENSFNLFMKNKINTYPNGYMECCLCGEIQSKKMSMERHMKIHYGPSVLCSFCGIQYEHEKLLQKHICDAKSNTIKLCSYICPYYRCGAMAISLLELYEHINEHLGERPYSCKQCEFSSSTKDELQSHCILNKECKLKTSVRVVRYWNIRERREMVVRKRVYFGQNNKNVVIIKRPLRTCGKYNSHLQRCPCCLKWCLRGSIYCKHLKNCTKNRRKKQKLKK